MPADGRWVLNDCKNIVLCKSPCIATGYGLDGPLRESLSGGGGGRFSAFVETGSWNHPASCTMGNGSFAGAEAVGGVGLNPQSHLVPSS